MSRYVLLNAADGSFISAIPGLHYGEYTPRELAAKFVESNPAIRVLLCEVKSEHYAETRFELDVDISPVNLAFSPLEPEPQVIERAPGDPLPAPASDADSHF